MSNGNDSGGTRTFAREYRPNSLDTYVGNEGIKESLRNTIKRGNLPQVILINGFTGSGKTTIARIIMKEYECTGRLLGQDACGVCESCKEFDSYIVTGNTDNLPDVNEINVAENSGKGDVVDLLEDRIYPPMYGKYKYYYLDEVHKASDALQNYLLKPIEEPEEHVVFILATTDPDKLLPTIRNRANLVLNVKKATESDIALLLGRVCQKEGIPFEAEAFRLIATRSDYILRESLNSLQQVVNAHGSCKAEDVSKEFEMVTDKYLFEFYRAYIQRDYMRYMALLHDIKTTMTFESFLMSLRAFTIRGVYVLNGVQVEGLSPKEMKEYSRLFSDFDVTQLSLLLSRLLALGKGNIEANLLNFMYRQNLEDSLFISSKVTENKNNVNGFVSDTTEGAVEQLALHNQVSDSPLAGISKRDEINLRNSRIEQYKEEAELRGQQALAKETEEVSLLDRLGKFQVQSVKGDL